MGLDMYLSRRIFVGGQYETRGVSGKIDITVDGGNLNIDPKTVQYIEQNVGYWRKANSIHNWFVQNVQEGEDNCARYSLSLEKLKELLSVVNDVLSTDEDKKEARAIELLPSSDGFFFGSKEYDEWYWQELRDTKNMLEEIIEKDNELRSSGIVGEYQYQSSW